MEPESVWDYPRPPRVEPVEARVRVIDGGRVVADTTRAMRVLETSHPPTYYIPPDDVAIELLEPDPAAASFCEFKGRARYWRLGDRTVAWSYPEPTPAFEGIGDHLAFYASRVDECWVGEQRVDAQEGDFYGGWITPNLRGPFKGGAGTAGW